MTSVYVNNAVFIFTRKAQPGGKGNCGIEKNPSVERMKKLVSEAWNKSSSTFFISDKPASLLNKFESLFTVLEAAGGRVKNSRGEILFIFRNGKWDLPKGKIEPGESTKSAAVREVEEECGISGLKPVTELCTTRHVYKLRGKQMLKKTHWFDMLYEGNEKLIPQKEEGITDVIWARKEKLPELLKNTYPSILEVLRRR